MIQTGDATGAPPLMGEKKKMKIGVPKEVNAGEKRVALTPETAGRIQKLGFDISVESGAGASAQFSDAAYREAGVEVVDDTRKLWGRGCHPQGP